MAAFVREPESGTVPASVVKVACISASSRLLIPNAAQINRQWKPKNLELSDKAPKPEASPTTLPNEGKKTSKKFQNVKSRLYSPTTASLNARFIPPEIAVDENSPNEKPEFDCSLSKPSTPTPKVISEPSKSPQKEVKAAAKVLALKNVQTSNFLKPTAATIHSMWKKSVGHCDSSLLIDPPKAQVKVSQAVKKDRSKRKEVNQASPSATIIQFGECATSEISVMSESSEKTNALLPDEFGVPGVQPLVGNQSTGESQSDNDDVEKQIDNELLTSSATASAQELGTLSSHEVLGELVAADIEFEL